LKLLRLLTLLLLRLTPPLRLLTLLLLRLLPSNRFRDHCEKPASGGLFFFGARVTGSPANQDGWLSACRRFPPLFAGKRKGARGRLSSWR